jgi:ammonia channel protein AmtB
MAYMSVISDYYYFCLTDIQAGFAFLEAGSVRAKNTTNILLKNTLDTREF